MLLSYISQQITIYLGWFFVIVGVIGNSINVWIFSSVRTYRTTPCSFYFLIASIDNICFLTINLISRIFMTGYEIDLTQTSLGWCKIRSYFLLTISLISFSCFCLASIDQFFATSRHIYLRNLSNIKFAHRIVLIVIVVSCLHGIPTFIYLNISSITQICININSIYTTYIWVYNLTFTCIIPVIIMTVFGYLTYRNIHQTRALAEQQADRQLTRMTLTQIILVLISNIPYGINNIYGPITSKINKDSDRLQIEAFVTTVVTILTYTYYAGSCYIFVISSNRFRRSIRNRILFWQKPNQIIPAQLVKHDSTTIRNIPNN